MDDSKIIRMGALRFVSVQKYPFKWEHGYPAEGSELAVDGPVLGLEIYYDNLGIVARTQIVGDSVNITLLPVSNVAMIRREAAEILKDAKALFDGIEQIHQGNNSGYSKMIELRDRINALDVAIDETESSGDGSV